MVPIESTPKYTKMKYRLQKAVIWIPFAMLVVSGYANSCEHNHINTQYDLQLSLEGRSFLIVTLGNTTNERLISHGLFLTPGIGSAGLHLTITDSNGRIHPLCAMIEQVDPGLGVIPPHGKLQKEIHLSWMKSVYCLQGGRYKVRATFAIPRSSASPRIVAESAPVYVNIR